MYELEIPPLNCPDDASEMIRFWVDGNEDAVMLNIGAMGEGEPEQWGMILADIARHAVNGLLQKYPHLNRAKLMKRIEKGYAGRMREKNRTSGSLKGDVQ